MQIAKLTLTIVVCLTLAAGAWAGTSFNDFSVDLGDWDPNPNVASITTANGGVMEGSFVGGGAAPLWMEACWYLVDAQVVGASLATPLAGDFTLQADVLIGEMMASGEIGTNTAIGITITGAAAQAVYIHGDAGGISGSAQLIITNNWVAYEVVPVTATVATLKFDRVSGVITPSVNFDGAGELVLPTIADASPITNLAIMYGYISKDASWTAPADGTLVKFDNASLTAAEVGVPVDNWELY